jgi:transcriptional regulator with XRE-family HTH domain
MTTTRQELKDWMEKQGVTTLQLAERLQKSYSSVANRLSGYAPLTGEFLAQCAKILTGPTGDLPRRPESVVEPDTSGGPVISTEEVTQTAYK